MDYLCRLKRCFYTLNLFESSTSHVDEFQASTERLSTRIYLIILLISLTICTIYLSLDIKTKTFNIDRPSQKTYEKLQEKYSSTIRCPCSTNTIPYREFFSISPVYHEVCSSVFISDEWLTSLHNINRTRYYQLDFRAIGFSIFQLLRVFCEWNKRNTEITLNQFASNVFLSRVVLSPEDFSHETESIFIDFERLVFGQQVQLPHIVLENIKANNFVPAVQTTGVFKVKNNGHIYLSNGIWPKFCWCPQRTDCVENLRLYDNLFAFQFNGIFDNILSSYADIPGLHIGCYILSSFLYSNLECLYNQTCIDLLKQKNDSYYEPLRINSNTSVIPLAFNFIIENDYFIRDRHKKIQYSNYYNICSPSNCQYSVDRRMDFLDILTNIFSIYGGLVMIYQIIIPMIVTKVRIWWIQRNAQSAAVDEQEEAIPIRTRLLHLRSFVHSTLAGLNVFSSIIPSIDPNEIQIERLATRIYILLFILISLPLLLVNILSIRFATETITNPTESVFAELHFHYGNYLQCPCTKSTIFYGEISNNIYRMHTICNDSHFINRDWLVEFPLEIKRQLTVLANICQRSRTTVDLADLIFASLILQTDYVLSREILDARLRAVYHQLQAQTKTEILTPFQLNRILIHTDKLLRNSDTQIYHPSGEIETIFNSYDNETCNCVLTSTCLSEIVSSFYTGCYPIDALLQSTLECFFNVDCVTLLESFRLEQMYNITILDSNDTRFSLNTTIESIFNGLMLEEWYIKINYTEYYLTCNPTHCTYSYPKKGNFISVVILLLGLLSGLNVILKLLVPIFVKIIRNCFIHRRIDFDIPAMISSWNTFPTYISRRGDIYQLNTEKLATRIYALVFVSCFVIMAAYKTATASIKNEMVYNPTQTTFENLQKFYGITMECPCREVNINYGSFVSISPVFHQVCSSYWISSSWFLFLFESSNSTNNHLFILSQFQFLSYVCQISHSFTFNSMFAFTNHSFISPKLIQESTLNLQIFSLMSNFLLMTSKSISETIEFIQGLTHGTGILSSLHTNWKLTLSEEDNITLFTDPISYENCSCDIYSSCTKISMISGLRIGCYPSSAMMQSTLECFYNETCISMFFGVKMWPSLIINNSSRFSPNRTVKFIVDQLMIEKWINTTNYTLYYEKCAPTSCSYSYSEQFSFIYMITMLTSLYGGLTMVLRFIVYYSITYIRNSYRRRTRVDVNIYM
ncbi:unnamed protein product [Adineta ricciae]|uniref:Uncharacterized protein n=1 Tax=Adineta ricciae TaxID=249248 RepID=A0A815UQP0_ADIRI|nr:unnamed protein product [Adineta ricciae]